jgi:hypothetical protein
MRWLRNTRTGQVIRWTPFLAAQQHFEEVEPPEQVLPQRSDPPAREGPEDSLVVAPAQAAPPVAKEAARAPDPEPANPPPIDEDGQLNCTLAITDRVKIQQRKNDRKRHHQSRG